MISLYARIFGAIIVSGIICHQCECCIQTMGLNIVSLVYLLSVLALYGGIYLVEFGNVNKGDKADAKKMIKKLKIFTIASSLIFYAIHYCDSVKITTVDSNISGVKSTSVADTTPVVNDHGSTKISHVAPNGPVAESLGIVAIVKFIFSMILIIFPDAILTFLKNLFKKDDESPPSPPGSEEQAA